MKISTTNNNQNTSFKLTPWRLNTGLEHANKIHGKDAIKIFENFKLGNYLDLDGGGYSYINSSIRRANLSFLDKVKDYFDKKEFVEYYKNLTGFPDLWSVAYRIKEEFKSAVNKAESIVKSNVEYSWHKEYYNVLGTGYDGVSSVAKRKALPGSDLDKAFVILKGYGHDKDNDIIDKFKSELWKNTDQRILSYNHDIDSFPKIYTDEQVSVLTSTIDDKMGLSKLGRVTPFGIFEAIARTIIEKDTPPSEYNNDYVEANSYFIKLCKKFPKKGDWNLDILNPSRENIYNFGFILEVLKWGEHFKKYDNWYINTSSAAKQLNVSQIFSLKNSSGYKDKYAKRERLENEFNNWDVDKQFRFIKSLIYNSCGEKTYDFPEYFASSEVDRFERLKREVGL